MYFSINGCWLFQTFYLSYSNTGYEINIKLVSTDIYCGVYWYSHMFTLHKGRQLSFCFAVVICRASLIIYSTACLKVVPHLNFYSVIKGFRELCFKRLTFYSTLRGILLVFRCVYLFILKFVLNTLAWLLRKLYSKFNYGFNINLHNLKHRKLHQSTLK